MKNDMGTLSEMNADDKAVKKQELRVTAGKKRDALCESEHKNRSLRIVDNIMSMREWKDSGVIYTYVSMGKEPYTNDLIETAVKEGKKVCVPRIFGKEMRFISITSAADLHPGTWGIMEPDDPGIYENIPGFVIVPGIVFGEDFVRVGYGAGYYDRFFEGHAPGDGWFLAAIGYEFQVYPSLPAEEFDVYMDAVVTEERVLRRNQK